MSEKLDARYIVVVSDIHCGSVYALLPPDFVLFDGNIVNQNAMQKWLWACWIHFWNWVEQKTGGDYAVVINGDSTEGIHHGGREIISPEFGDHKGAAILALKPYCKGRSVYVIEGTDCHTKNGESEVGRTLDAIPYRSPLGGDAGVFSWPQLDLDINGCTGTIRHHITTAIRPYLEATGMSVQLGTDRIECVRAGLRPPQFLVSAHRHRGGFFCDLDAVSAVCPPWQGLTRHGRKVVGGARAVVGGLILDFTHADADNAPNVLFKRYRP